MTDDDERYMKLALAEAHQAAEQDEVPVGAVVIHQDRIVGRGFNQRELLQDPTAHAEMIAITAAANGLGSWRLVNCRLYVTLEPCLMCAGAIVQARIAHLIYGATDRKAGACGSVYRIPDDGLTNHVVSITGGVLADPCRLILEEFFHAQRKLGKK
ncbi:MAG: nucleoside deaminase [Planctomycetes bacterium]|nr:nucleoside deaminase [Planctomycetota bacterium]